MLHDIITLFKKQKLLNTNELSIRFEIDESAMEAILLMLQQKGYIKRLNVECNSCSLNCKSCRYASQKDYYEYIKS